jgi:NIPSNAP protein
MQRRRFLKSSIAASALAAAAGESLNAQANAAREYYELRCYKLQSGDQPKLAHKYFAEALIPALNRMGMNPIGVFDLYLGPETPAFYVLIPSASVEALATSELHLAHDEEYLKAAEEFDAAPAKQPAFGRIESSLMIAFEGYPKLTVPPVTAKKGARVFQMRTYESPSLRDHRRKVEMFNSGEFDIFAKAGFWNVFFGDTLVGARLPNLTYMLSFPDLSELDAKWKAFVEHPDWKKLSSDPKFAFESIVSNITNVILHPTGYSQI